MVTKIKANPTVATYAGFAFFEVNEFNIYNMVKEMEIYKRMITTLEGEVSHYKPDMTSMEKFKAYTFELHNELNVA